MHLRWFFSNYVSSCVNGTYLGQPGSLLGGDTEALDADEDDEVEGHESGAAGADDTRPELK